MSRNVGRRPSASDPGGRSTRRPRAGTRSSTTSGTSAVTSRVARRLLRLRAHRTDARSRVTDHGGHHYQLGPERGGRYEELVVRLTSRGSDIPNAATEWWQIHQAPYPERDPLDERSSPNERSTSSKSPQRPTSRGWRGLVSRPAPSAVAARASGSTATTPPTSTLPVVLSTTRSRARVRATCATSVDASRRRSAAGSRAVRADRPRAWSAGRDRRHLRHDRVHRRRRRPDPRDRSTGSGRPTTRSSCSPSDHGDMMGDHGLMLKGCHALPGLPAGAVGGQHAGP